MNEPDQLYRIDEEGNPVPVDKFLVSPDWILSLDPDGSMTLQHLKTKDEVCISPAIWGNIVQAATGKRVVVIPDDTMDRMMSMVERIRFYETPEDLIRDAVWHRLGQLDDMLAGRRPVHATRVKQEQKSRRLRYCESCQGTIPKGDPYVRGAYLIDDKTREPDIQCLSCAGQSDGQSTGPDSSVSSSPPSP